MHHQSRNRPKNKDGFFDYYFGFDFLGVEIVEYSDNNVLNVREENLNFFFFWLKIDEKVYEKHSFIIH